VKTMIRVAPYCREQCRKKGTSSANGEYIELPQTRVKVGRGLLAGKRPLSAHSKGESTD
jgi:hypothetical protein